MEAASAVVAKGAAAAVVVVVAAVAVAVAEAARVGAMAPVSVL